MRFFSFILLFSFALLSSSFAKLLNIENKIQIEVPTSHKFIEYDNDEVKNSIEEIVQDYEGMEIDLYLVGPKKYVDLEKAILDGEDPMDNKFVREIVKKLERKNFRNEDKAAKWMIAESKKIMRREKIDFITYVLVLNKTLSDLLVEGNELDDIIIELQSMNNSEIQNKTKEIKNMISSLEEANDKSYFFGPTRIDYNKFKIGKNEYGNLFLKGPSNISFALNDMITIDAKLNVFFGAHNNRTYLMISSCFVECSKFNTKFNKMITPVFSTKLQIADDIKKTVDDNNIVDQLNSLNELYKSGVLTKEEFEKAKKKILN
jgi:hypothetical protein|tara:strand:- start:156 stop:1109 length:954 start_codon:yes stop_codon:yes gene_type:complete